jgi:hypothetical protein
MQVLSSLTRRLAALSFLAALPALAGSPLPSSHREAPAITKHPKVDSTDFYMFRSYESGRSGYVTVIANYVPVQATYGGPNFFTLDPEALYEIHFDTNGDAKEDFTFQFRFSNTLANNGNGIALNVGGKQVGVPVINVGGISAGNSANLNVTESYTVTLVTGDRRKGTRTALSNGSGSSTFGKPVDNIGAKSIPNYHAYASSFISNLALPGGGTGRVFVGQRKDPFVVNLGETFDLVNISNPLGAENAERDSLEDDNVTSLILELPISFLTNNGANPIVGGWTSASLRQARVLNPKPTYAIPSKEGGPWTQVSRLSNPLVNELVIGLKDKDRFNSSHPSADGQFADYVTNPTLPAILEILFGGAGVKAPTLFPRTDLVSVFLTGVDTLNKPANVVASEMLRLNTATPAVPAASQNRLGVIGGDVAGFPNGRRPGDDVVDVALRVVMGKLLTPAQAPSGQLAFTDGAFVDASFFDSGFPYLKDPLAGAPNDTPAHAARHAAGAR